MKTSQEIMNLIYGPEAGDDLYQKNRRLYFAISEKLNASARSILRGWLLCPFFHNMFS